jgi:signal recognition particle receptor subunit beta
MGSSKSTLRTTLKKIGCLEKRIGSNQLIIVMVLMCNFLVTLWRELGRFILTTFLDSPRRYLLLSGSRVTSVMELVRRMESFGMRLVQPLNALLRQCGLSIDVKTLFYGMTFFSVFLLFFLAVIFAIFFRRRWKSNTIVITGLCDAGKTALFLQLTEGRSLPTVTSMKPNEFVGPLHGNFQKIKVHLVDFPGHERLREQLNKFLQQAAGVVFLVDAVDIQSQLNTCAQYLYDILVHPSIYKGKVGIHIACNKSDIITAKSPEVIQSALEAEIDELRSTRSAAPGAMHQTEQEEVYLGVEGEPFKMHHLPLKVTFSRCSAATGDIESVRMFIRNCVA